MNIRKINLLNGYATVPATAKIVDISEGNSVDYVAVIVDRKRELDPIVVLSDTSMGCFHDLLENQVVNDVIADLPEYKEVKALELPWPGKDASDDEYREWFNSFRLGFFPLDMFVQAKDSDGYGIYRDW